MKAEFPQFGARLRDRRALVGMTQRGLSSYVHRSASYVSMLEKGVFLPSTAVGLAIAQKLGVTLEWLLTGEDSKGVK